MVPPQQQEHAQAQKETHAQTRQEEHAQAQEEEPAPQQAQQEEPSPQEAKQEEPAPQEAKQEEPAPQQAQQEAQPNDFATQRLAGTPQGAEVPEDILREYREDLRRTIDAAPELRQPREFGRQSPLQGSLIWRPLASSVPH